MASLQHYLENLARTISAICCALLAVFAITDVLGRPAGLMTSLSLDIGVYLTAILIFLPLGENTRNNTHIAADFFLVLLPPRIQNVLAYTSKVAFLIFATTLLYLCADLTLTSFRDGTRPLNLPSLPIWIPQTAMVIGLFLLWSRLILQLFESKKNNQQE